MKINSTHTSFLSRGFTIVELAVVIAVIGILAGITVVGYGKWRESIAQKEVQSDLKMAASAMESAKNFGDGYPASIPSTFRGSANVTITYYSGTSTAYCVNGVSKTHSSVRYFIDTSLNKSKEPVFGTCENGEEIPGQVAKGDSWVARTAAEANSWKSVAFGKGLFVAVSTNGTNRVMTSSDGITWTARPLPPALQGGTWQAVTYGNGLFVAVSQSGTDRVMTSPDGITWTGRSVPEGNTWWAIAYGNGMFVAVSRDGTNRVMTSPDGITWTARAATEPNGWYAITYGGGSFVAVANNGTNRVMTSPDGITWTARTLPSNIQTNGWVSVAYGNGMYAALAVTGTQYRVMTSPDGVTWTARTVPEPYNNWSAVTYGNGLFVAVSEGSAIMTSPDGITWTARIAPEGNIWSAVAYGKGLFTAVSRSGTNRVMTSE